MVTSSLTAGSVPKGRSCHRYPRDIQECWFWCVLGLLLSGTSFTALAEDVPPAEAAPPEAISTADLVRLVMELEHPDFAVRDAATRALLKAGAPAASEIGRVLAGKASAETQRRGLFVLRELLLTNDEATSAAAGGALAQLAATPDAELARRASLLITLRQDRVLEQLFSLGAQMEEEDGRVIGLWFEGSAITDDHLKLARELVSLRVLSLTGTKITDAGLAHLRGHPALQDLALYRTKVSDAGLPHLATMPELKSIQLGSTQVTAKGLDLLVTLKKLEYLGLRELPMTDADIARIPPSLTSLQGLYLGETQVTNDGLKPLAELKSLKRLWLNGTSVTDAGLEHLHPITTLRQLDLNESPTTREGRLRLKSVLPDLTILDQRDETPDEEK